MCLLAFRHTIVVLMTVNAQNHYFTLYQLGPFQLQVIENPAPKYFIQKKEVLIHVSEKSWLQAQLDRSRHFCLTANKNNYGHFNFCLQLTYYSIMYALL